MMSFVAFLVLGACNREGAPKDQGGAAMSMPESNAVPAAAAVPPPVAAGSSIADRELEIVEPNASARVRVKLPASWEVNETQMVLRDEFKEAIAGMQFSILCNEGCGDADLARIPQILEQTFEKKARPNVDTGDPKLDAIRMNVDLVAQGDLPDGKFRVARMTRPADARGPYRDQLYAVCIRAKQGAKVVAAQAWAPIDKEAELGELLIAACKTFEIL